MADTLPCQECSIYACPMTRAKKVEDIRQQILNAETSEEIDALFGSWLSLIETSQEKIEYCEDRLQYLESDLASMDESAFIIHGSKVKSEIAWLKGEIRKQERALQQQPTNPPSLLPSGPSEVLVWDRSLTDLAKLLYVLIEERCIEKDRIDHFVSKHIQIRNEDGNLSQIDRKRFATLLRQFKSPTGTAKGSEKINEILDDERVIRRRKE